MLDNTINPCYTDHRKVVNMEDNFGILDVEELHQYRGEPHDAELTLEDYFDIFLEEFN